MREHRVTRPVHNVIPLPRQGGRHENLPVPMERLCAAMRDLQDFRDCVADAARNQRWSATEWGIACTPLLLRLPEARQSLTDLAGIRAGTWPDTPWAVHLRTAHDEVEQRLNDVSVSATSLIRKETCTTDAAVNLGFDGVKLMEALDGLFGLIKARYPAAAQHT